MGQGGGGRRHPEWVGREASAPSMPLPGSLSHRRGLRARRVAGSTGPTGRGRGRAAPRQPASSSWASLASGSLAGGGVGTVSFRSREGLGGGGARDSRSKIPSAEGETETLSRELAGGRSAVRWAAQDGSRGDAQQRPARPWAWGPAPARPRRSGGLPPDAPAARPTPWVLLHLTALLRSSPWVTA